jgi:hypothetical protein
MAMLFLKFCIYSIININFHEEIKNVSKRKAYEYLENQRSLLHKSFM